MELNRRFRLAGIYDGIMVAVLQTCPALGTFVEINPIGLIPAVPDGTHWTKNNTGNTVDTTFGDNFICHKNLLIVL